MHNGRQGTRSASRSIKKEGKGATKYRRSILSDSSPLPLLNKEGNKPSCGR